MADVITTVELAEWDWVVTKTWRVLHHMASVDDPAHFDEECCGEGVTSCGVRSWLHIPGLFSRMGLPRCQKCCKHLGYPPGIGSPKNDDQCRLLVEARLANV